MEEKKADRVGDWWFDWSVRNGYFATAVAAKWHCFLFGVFPNHWTI